MPKLEKKSIRVGLTEKQYILFFTEAFLGELLFLYKLRVFSYIFSKTPKPQVKISSLELILD
jgi:hypothetical protein